MTAFSGYNPNFISDRHPVSLPALSKTQQADTLKSPAYPSGFLRHANYTVVLCASRRMAWFSSANLDAKSFQQVTRRQLSNYWKLEEGLTQKAVTWDAWYKLSAQKLQRGHLTPADCMEWGKDVPDAIGNANTTFYYSNAVPQIKRLNGREWGMLERYIGLECLKAGNARLCVHTGPVLQSIDPKYIHQVEAQDLQLPLLFWKVIWYLDEKAHLSRIGFLMSQSKLLRASGLIHTPEKSPRDVSTAGPFEDLGNYKTYQVDVKVIQQLTGLHFAAAARNPYAGKRPLELILKEIDVPESFEPKIQQGIVERAALAPGKKNLKILVGLEL